MAKQSKKKRSDGIQECKMEMTPMSDVTFLLIIFFICLKFKTLEGKLTAYLPKDLGVTTAKADPILKLDVQIHLVNKGTATPKGNRKVWSNRKVKWVVKDQTYHDIDSLEKGLRRFRELTPNTNKNAKPGDPVPVTVHAYPGVFYGEVTQTVDVILSDSVGFKEVTFAGGRA